MESFVHKVDGCIMQHVEEFVDARTKKRRVIQHDFVYCHCPVHLIDLLLLGTKYCLISLSKQVGN